MYDTAQNFWQNYSWQSCLLRAGATWEVSDIYSDSIIRLSFKTKYSLYNTLWTLTEHVIAPCTKKRFYLYKCTNLLLMVLVPGLTKVTQIQAQVSLLLNIEFLPLQTLIYLILTCIPWKVNLKSNQQWNVLLRRYILLIQVKIWKSFLLRYLNFVWVDPIQMINVDIYYFIKRW